MPKTRIDVHRKQIRIAERAGADWSCDVLKNRKIHQLPRAYFPSLKGRAFKANYFDVASGEEFWISGPRKDGDDRLYSQSTQPVEIDDDVAEEYWRDVRGKLPE